MNKIIRLIAVVAVVALSIACSPRSGQAVVAASPTAQTCAFVRNDLPCPCPRAQQARAFVRAARTTVVALANAVGTTVEALRRVDLRSAVVSSR